MNDLPDINTIEDLNRLPWEPYEFGKIPKRAGCYRFIDIEQGKVVYVGTSKNIWHRTMKHIASGKLDKSKHRVEVVLESDNARRLMIEARYLDLCKPELNQREQHHYWRKLTPNDREEIIRRAYEKIYG